ncbi:hypothetical protein CK503_03415 [Aliifodinibius salipaludis]|uniref:Uncharacterized protein n=1 Tax=Fodinibius salipaludis TaxID=2032627 RepID=A0A2A2GEF3_9BACT|nr:hypothetical protein [Aliifodinibius salipaludis]PAU95259.1 hypothetical protein CK503_03415 [Aliifodinibius salipaludis]
MSEDAIIVAIVFGSILGMIAIPMLINLAKKWVDRNNSSIPEEQFDRLAKAFMQHKKDTQRRIQNLEAIISDDDPTESSQNKEATNKIEAPKESIEFDDSDNVSEESESNGNENNLRNMLRE